MTAWTITLVLCGFAPILTITSLLVSRPVKKNVIEIKKVQTETASLVEEILFKIKTVSSFANFLFETKRYEEKVFKAKGIMKFRYMWISFAGSIYHIVLWGVVSLGTWYGSRLIFNRDVNTNTGKLI